MKKILITGANGFLGSYFINKYKYQYTIKTFSFLKDNFNALYIKNIDVVIHFSALVHQMSGTSAQNYKKVNITQTVDLAKKAKSCGVKQFVFMSTVKVYGEESDFTYKETSLCKSQDEYGKSKLKAEKKLQELEDDNFKISIIRTPIVYGYGVKANIKNLVNLVKQISILPLGRINNKRSMVYIGNLCHLIDQNVKQGNSGVFLASDDEAISTTKFCEIIAYNLGKKIYLIKIPFFESFLKLVKPSFYKRLYKSLEVDNSETQKILNLKNPYSIKEGIEFMIKGENFDS